MVGFHGHTVLHAPERALTVQLGDGVGLARRLAIDVVYDLRAADVAAGGQGAPLAPAYHGALMARQRKPVVIVNIGGVANVTWIGSSGELLAFDTGPGNAMIDDWMQRRQGLARDETGSSPRGGARRRKSSPATCAMPISARRHPNRSIAMPLASTPSLGSATPTVPRR